MNIHQGVCMRLRHKKQERRFIKHFLYCMKSIKGPVTGNIQPPPRPVPFISCAVVPGAKPASDDRTLMGRALDREFIIKTKKI